MSGHDATSDKELQKMVNRRLQRSGSQAGVVATVQRGTVTITGKLRTEDQRITIVRALRSVNGVRQVIDQLQSPPKREPQRYEPARPVPTATSLGPGDAANHVGQDGASTEMESTTAGDVDGQPSAG